MEFSIGTIMIMESQSTRHMPPYPGHIGQFGLAERMNGCVAVPLVKIARSQLLEGSGEC